MQDRRAANPHMIDRLGSLVECRDPQKTREASHLWAWRLLGLRDAAMCCPVSGDARWADRKLQDDLVRWELCSLDENVPQGASIIGSTHQRRDLSIIVAIDPNDQGIALLAHSKLFDL